jgi:oligopeptide/dipeptide ABC transporter ATP-binding protein
VTKTERTSAPVLSDELLRVEGLTKTFRLRLGLFKHADLRAVEGVTFTLGQGQTLGVVGESGSGKTTLGRLLIRLIEPTSGTITLGGVELTGLSGSELRSVRSRMQMVFQDPLDSLSPWQSIGQTVSEPIQLHEHKSASEAADRVAGILERVGLSRNYAKRYPHQLSGGQQQRVGIARAVVTNPDLVVLDEPTSSLDVSVQAQILQLLRSLQDERHLTYVFITHDLSIARFLAHFILVMYLGRIVETGPTKVVLSRPAHPYTSGLLAASPRPDPRRSVARARLSGEQPSPLDLRPGCPLFSRCPLALPSCETMPQQLVPIAPDHEVACWRVAPPPDLDPSLQGQVVTGTT